MSTTPQRIRFGVIGCGLMGHELASAIGRWCHLGDLGFAPTLVAACDPNPAATEFFRRHVLAVTQIETDDRKLLDSLKVDAIYRAVPRHLHADLRLGESAPPLERIGSAARADRLRRSSGSIAARTAMFTPARRIVEPAPTSHTLPREREHCR